MGQQLGDKQSTLGIVIISSRSLTCFPLGGKEGKKRAKAKGYDRKCRLNRERWLLKSQEERLSLPSGPERRSLGYFFLKERHCEVTSDYSSEECSLSVMTKKTVTEFSSPKEDKAQP